MTSPLPDPKDAHLDARIKAASTVRFNEIAATQAVLARIAARQIAPQRRGEVWFQRLGPVVFASVLLATPFVVAYFPGADLGTDAMMIGLATGDPMALIAEAGFAGETDLRGALE
jgi:hypothetical protein